MSRYKPDLEGVRALVKKLVEYRETVKKARGLVLIDGEWCHKDGTKPAKSATLYPHWASM